MIDIVEFEVGPAPPAGFLQGQGPVVVGRILALQLNHTGVWSGETNVSLSDPRQGTFGGGLILSLTGGADFRGVTYYPRRQVQTQSGADATYDGVQPVLEPFVIHGPLTVEIDGASPGDRFQVRLWLER